ncbi:MAG TPA: hypothetical protein VEX12_03930 [Microbacterium sp.]|nr:hypothetical protein [Microbacterium sp.]
MGDVAHSAISAGGRRHALWILGVLAVVVISLFVTWMLRPTDRATGIRTESHGHRHGHLDADRHPDTAPRSRAHSGEHDPIRSLDAARRPMCSR